MANLEFYDTYNMVAYLQKPKGSEGFHQIVYFLNTSHIRYALTKNPTIYVSLIQQFWQTATASTLDNGEIEITTTIDGKVKVVTEASVRRHLKLEYSKRISNLPTTKIFKQLALMGNVSNSDKLTFQKEHFSPQWRFLIHTILHCLSSKKTVWEQFSSNIATSLICLATNRKFNFSKLIFDGMVKNLDSKTEFLMYLRFIQIFLNKHKRLFVSHKSTYIAPTHTQKRFSNMKRTSKGYSRMDIPLFLAKLVQGLIFQGEGSTVPVKSHHTPTGAPSISQPHLLPTPRSFIRHENEVPQPSSPPYTNVADEAASIGVDVRHGGAATTVTSLDAGHGSGDINKTSSMPYDLPLPRVHTLGSDKGIMQHNEFIDLVTKLSDRVVALEIDLKQTKKVYGAAYTNLLMKGRKIDEIDQDLNISLIQHDAEIRGRYDQDIEFNLDFDATKEVSTAKKEVSTTEPVSTIGATVTTASVDVSPTNPTRRVSNADNITMAETLVYIRRIVAKDKGKGIMTESEPIQTKKKLQQEQERLGYEAAVRLQEELDEEERQRMARVHEAAQSFTREEWEKIRERRKRYFATQKVEEKRNKPMTQAQQRTYMSNYIKHIGSHTLQQLSRYSFNELKTLFETTLRRVNTFVPMKSEVDKAVPKFAAGSSKRGAEELDQGSSKRQKTSESLELAEAPRDKDDNELLQEEP
nr:hypothetical protein [Tanacetum cinerariifolium]